MVSLSVCWGKKWRSLSLIQDRLQKLVSQEIFMYAHYVSIQFMSWTDYAHLFTVLYIKNLSGSTLFYVNFFCRCLTCLVIFKAEILLLNNMMDNLSKSLVTRVVWVISVFMTCDECSTTHCHAFLWGRHNLFFKMLSTRTSKLFYFTVTFTVIASAVSEMN